MSSLQMGTGKNAIRRSFSDVRDVVPVPNLIEVQSKSFNDFVGQLFQVSVDGGLSSELPLPSGGFCSFSADGKELAYNRVCREFRTWKYYKGGMADDVWIYNFDTKATEDITNNVAQDIFPMWTGNKIYYLSDRDRTMNMFYYDKTTKSYSLIFISLSSS